MKKRVVKKAERFMLVDKVCELQRRIYEYERFLADLLLLLCARKTDLQVLKHDVEGADWIWNRVKMLLKENADLREKSGIGDTADSEHPAGL